MVLADEQLTCNIAAIGVLTNTHFTASRHMEVGRSWVILHLLRDVDRRGLGRIHELAKPYRRKPSLSDLPYNWFLTSHRAQHALLASHLRTPWEEHPYSEFSEVFGLRQLTLMFDCGS